MDKLFTWITEQLNMIFSGRPWLFLLLFAAVAVLTGWYVVRRIRQGDEVSVLGLLTFRPNQAAGQRLCEVARLQESLKQRQQMLALLQAIVMESSKALSGHLQAGYTSAEYRKAVYDFVLPSLLTLLAKPDRANAHRVALFLPAADGTMRMHEGIGFSPEGKKELVLPPDSAAGYVCRTGEPYCSGDVTAPGSRFCSNPKASKRYHSLLCLPIRCGPHVIGVLSVDGRERDSFAHEDQEFLTYVANALSLFLYIELQQPPFEEASRIMQSQP